MNTSQVIDELAERFGATGKFLVEEMARYYIATDIVVMAISALVTVVCLFAVKISYKKAKEDDWDTDISAVVMILGLIGCFIAVIFFIYNLTNCVGWIVSPTAGAINYIVR